ncbi:MAG TPA: hypothetical protein VLG41_07155 [Hydrogenophaga sp.]|uniref:hypothetical protein n=1 Tax=Hydrogenophaga sp. TaxID=1904254 RepID=UPI002B5D37F8|nr:hypothetical protein [Hydrogenophaga sp.]HSX92680.1 hypothetical protein [Hydrogenophaga sp.]
MGAVILYVLPDPGQTGWADLGIVVDRLASFIPSISRWGELSPWPGNTKLFAVFVWVMIPVQFYWLISSRALVKYVPEEMRAVPAVSQWKRVLVLVQFTVVVFAFFALPYFFAIVDSEPCRVCVNTDRLAQLALGCAFSLTASGLAAYLHLLVKLFFKSIVGKGNKNV